MASIKPGSSLGFLRLGMSLHSVLSTLRALPGPFSKIEVSFSKEDPVTNPVVVILDQAGLRLHFDGSQQTLRLIELVEWGKMKTMYKNTELGRQGPPTFRNIYSKTFGPTYPGKYYADTRSYILSYPGIAFRFQIDNDQVEGDDFLKYLSGPNAPPCSSMVLFHGNSWVEAYDNLFDLEDRTANGNGQGQDHGEGKGGQQEKHSESIPVSLPVSNDAGTIEINYISLDPPGDKSTIYFASHPGALSSFDIIICKTSIQEVLMTLGAPSERFFKQDTRLSIHNPAESNEEVRTDLFFNYFNLGLDICFDTQQPNPPVKKVVVHGNVPGSLPFQKYRRCRWKLPGGVTSEQKFSEYSEKYPHNKRPMVLNRTLESPGSSVELVGEVDPMEEVNDWGLTDLYGSTGCVFEVLENSAVVSLTIY
uniref:ARAD1D33880p n=1 Tax=Blastobotrys adeninivorans TaxID=409370 RepID=A0A060THT1_BLAAD